MESALRERECDEERASYVPVSMLSSKVSINSSVFNKKKPSLSMSNQPLKNIASFICYGSKFVQTSTVINLQTFSTTRHMIKV